MGGRNEDLTTAKEKTYIEKKASTKKNNKRNKMFENRSYQFQRHLSQTPAPECQLGISRHRDKNSIAK